MKIVDMLKTIGLMNATTTSSTFNHHHLGPLDSSLNITEESDIDRIHHHHYGPHNQHYEAGNLPHSQNHRPSSLSAALYNEMYGVGSGAVPGAASLGNFQYPHSYYNYPGVLGYDQGTSGNDGAYGHGGGAGHTESVHQTGSGPTGYVGGQMPEHSAGGYDYHTAPAAPVIVPEPPLPPKHYSTGGHVHGGAPTAGADDTKTRSGSSALSALTLLSFFFFVNLLQSCLKEHMDTMSPTIMIMTADVARNRFDKLAEMNSREHSSFTSSSPPILSSLRPDDQASSPLSSSSLSSSSSQSSSASNNHAHHHQPTTNSNDDDYSASAPAPAPSSSYNENENENSKIQFYNRDPAPEYYNSNSYPNRTLLTMSTDNNNNYHWQVPSSLSYSDRNRPSLHQSSSGSTFASASLPANVGGNNYFDRADSHHMRIN